MNKLENIRIVLCHTSHPGNIGSAARAMKTMGLSRLCLVQPRKFPHADALAMASGATDVLDATEVYDTLEEALAGVTLAIGLSARERELSHAPMSAHAAAAEAIATAGAEQVALVFGSETNGLTNEQLIRCQRLAHIPANPDYSSLNLGAAVQVLAYELRLASQQGTPLRENRLQAATHDEIEGFYAHLEQTLVAIGFLDPAVPRRLMLRLRRLFTRAGLEKEEVNILRGILKSIADK